MIAVSSMQRPHTQPRTRLEAHQYTQLRRLVKQHAGIHLSPDKQREVEGKLARCWDPHHSVGAFLTELSRSPEQLQQVVEELTVGESYFYRNRPHFEALRTHVLPDLLRSAEHRRKLAMWSAACATGEEPYSLAMLMDQHFEVGDQWSITIRGSDLNRSSVARAGQARYPKWSLRSLDPSLVQHYFHRAEDDSYQLRPMLARRVTLAAHNLTADVEPPGKPTQGFDLILCRNVLIYFERQSSEQVLRKLISALRPGGYLFVGHADSYPILGSLEPVYKCGTFYYRKPVRPQGRPNRTSQLIPGLPVAGNVPALSTSPGLAAAPTAPTAPPEPATVSGPVTAPADDRVATVLEQARRQANQSDPAAALTSLRSLAGGAGKLDHRVHFMYALVADQAGLIDDSRRSLRQALFLKRDFIVAHYFLGVLAERNEDWPEAQRCFRNVGKLLTEQAPDEVLEETAGLTAGRLKEIAQQRLGSIRAEKSSR